MSIPNDSSEEGLNMSIAKLLGVIGTVENVDEVNRMLEDLLNNLKDRKNRPNIPEQPHDLTQGQPKQKPTKEKFDYKTCEAYHKLTEEIFYPTIRQNELVSIATAVAGRCNDLRVDRDAKRRKDLLIKWYQEHWSEIEPHLKNLVAFNKEGEVLNRGGKSNVTNQQHDEIMKSIREQNERLEEEDQP